MSAPAPATPSRHEVTRSRRADLVGSGLERGRAIWDSDIPSKTEDCGQNLAPFCSSVMSFIPRPWSIGHHSISLVRGEDHAAYLIL
jgi:hypothetical protein